MRDVQIGRRHRKVAAAWNELTGRQLLRICRLLQQPLAPGQELRPALLHVLFRVPRRVMRQLTPVQLLELRPLTNFLVDPLKYAPLTSQLLPVLRLPWWRGLGRRHYGPAERLRNVRFVEFIAAETHYLHYLKSSDEASLDQLVAVLYRPEREDYNPRSASYQGDRREDYNDYLVAARAQHLAKLPRATKLAVLLFYGGCRRDLTRRYERVFSADNEAKAEQGSWADVLLNLADGVHRVEATASQPTHTVLREMQRVLLHYDRQLEAYAK